MIELDSLENSPPSKSKLFYSGVPGWAFRKFAVVLQLVTSILLSLVDWEMNQNEKRDLLEVAMQAVGQVLNDQQNRMFSNGALRPNRFPSDAFSNWVQWKLHFVAVAEANRWTQIQAINTLPVCISGYALDEFHAAPAELKQHVNGEPAPCCRHS